MTKSVNRNDIVQIIDEGHPWFPALLVVSEVKPWGVQAYTLIVTNNEEPNGQAYNRLPTGTFEVVGRAVIVNAEDGEDHD